jgi:1-acyl-sn-glycerol-3-phosphate acyltransferase
MERVGMIFVNRSSNDSRAATATLIAKGVVEKRHQVGLFPEGTSSFEMKEWKRGGFVIAHKFNHKLMVSTYYHILINFQDLI